MPRRSPRSRRKAAAAKLPQTPRVRSAPGKSRTAAARGTHAGKGARGTAAAAKPRSARAKPARTPRAAGKALATRATRPTRAAGPSRRGAARVRALTPDPVRVRAILEQLRERYPEAECALDFASPLQLLVATILSAQCTDERVNKVTPGLFAAWPDAAALAGADPAALERAIHSTGFFRNKAKAIREACADIISKHRGEVPRTIEELTALRGVGRKTANVVLGNAWGINAGINAGIVVDTHVGRLSHRLGLTHETDAVKIEFALMPLVPKPDWTLFAHWLILHGRAVCNARKPLCSACPLSPHCPRIDVSASA